MAGVDNPIRRCGPRESSGELGCLLLEKIKKKSVCFHAVAFVTPHRIYFILTLSPYINPQ